MKKIKQFLFQSYELIERLQENNKTIEKNNLSLLQELETANKRLHDQQKIFENQVGELNQMFEKIKNQNSYE